MAQGPQVEITPEMAEAGAYALRDARLGEDFASVAKSVYFAMEYERLEALSLSDQRLKIGQPQSADGDSARVRQIGS